MSDEEMKERCMIPARLMLDEDCDEETFDFEKEDRSVVELTAREHKPALLKQAEQVEKDMAYFDSDKKCNKSE